MKYAKIVIGVGYGDEGKGLTTDYLAQNFAGLVVRSQGGAQAAHTVKHRNGLEHVFGHFGSGTLRDIPTYLAPRFVVHPHIFYKEREELVAKGLNPKVFVDENCIVATMADTFINRTIEKWRGANNHGSVGIGFNEAIHRHLTTSHKIIVKDLNEINKFNSTVFQIWSSYVPKRLHELGMSDYEVWSAFKDLSEEGIRKDAYEKMQYFDAFTSTVTTDILHYYDTAVFEGAQGLLLDEKQGVFPHVTRSRTGIKNPTTLLRGMNANVEVYYVTRAYQTRHGAGPMPNECLSTEISDLIVDETNKPHPFQETLRFAPLNPSLIAATISNDLPNSALSRFNINLVVTCMDQMRSIIPIYKGGCCQYVSTGNFIDILAKEVNIPMLLNYSAYTPQQMYKL